MGLAVSDMGKPRYLVLGKDLYLLTILRLEVIPAQSTYHYRLRLLYPLLSSTVPTPPIHTTDVVVINCWAYSRAKDSSSPMLSIFASASVSLPPLPSLSIPCYPLLPTLSSLLPPSPPSRLNRSVRLRQGFAVREASGLQSSGIYLPY